jgi:hypothetical protein
MVIIKPTFWRPGTVVGAVVIGAICLYPLVLHVGIGYKLAGLGVLMGMALMSWLLSRPIQLEITENEVRAKEGWTHAPLGKKEAFRSEIRSIHAAPGRFSFRGDDGQPLMETSPTWTVQDMVKAARELQVPLYDDRIGQLKARERNKARLVYDPATGQMTAGEGR